MDPLVQLCLGFFAGGALAGILLSLMFSRVRRLGKARLLLVDPDGRTIRDYWAKVKDGKVETKNKTVILQGLAKFGGTAPTWIINPENGWNYTFPTRAQTVDADLKLAVLEPSNPESYHRAIFRHRWDDTFRAGEEPNKYAWVPLVAVLGFILLLLILGGIGYVVTHLPAAVAPGAK